ncbi:hypothetical protein FACS1894191_8230 [Clostridia bacterium]|nr:hypothetical protein FACS1894191_8230 [Clostridia bacterium]
MKRPQEIKVVLHLPETDIGVDIFRRKLCDFYSTQIEKRIHTYPLEKEEKLEILRLFTEEISKHSTP